MIIANEVGTDDDVEMIGKMLVISIVDDKFACDHSKSLLKIMMLMSVFILTLLRYVDECIFTRNFFYCLC